MTLLIQAACFRFLPVGHRTSETLTKIFSRKSLEAKLIATALPRRFIVRRWPTPMHVTTITSIDQKRTQKTRTLCNDTVCYAALTVVLRSPCKVSWASDLREQREIIYWHQKEHIFRKLEVSLNAHRK